jgi:ATP-binding cassette, subfamily C, bacterial
MNIYALPNIFTRQKHFKVKVPLVMQFSETECGIAALAMLFAYHKAHFPIDLLREKCGASRDGCKATTLINVAKDLGFQAAGYKVELTDIVELKQPLIAFWNFNHYVVIYGADDKRVYLNDPACGTLAVSLEEFDKAFTGIVITIIPTPSVQKSKKPFTLFNLIDKWFREFWKEWIFMILVSLLLICGPLLNSALSSIFINYCIVTMNKLWVPWLALFSTVITGFYIVTTVMQKNMQFRISTKASLVKLAKLATHALKLPLLYYALRQKSEIINIFARAESVVDGLFKNLTIIAVNLLMAVICLFFMVKIDFSLAIKSILIIVIFTIIMYLLGNLNYLYEKHNINYETKLYAYAMSSLRNLETIKASVLENGVLTKWFQLFSKRMESQDKLLGLAAKIMAVSQFANTFPLLIILYWGAVRVADGYLSLGNLMAYYALHLAFCRNVDAILLALKEGQTAYAAHCRIDDIENYNEDERFKITKNNIINIQEPLLTCKNLTFYYNKHSKPDLNNINLFISRSQQVAFVGTTGSGKSTLAKLLCGLYGSQQGEILLSGNNFANFAPADFSKYFAYVGQDVSLFAGTLYENLTLGCDEIHVDKITQAITTACLQDLLKIRGLYAAVMEGGNNFSGGEKQRIDIARALLQDTPILVLDEATSALDIHTEKLLISNLRNLNKTIIYVAHRLSTIQHCDQIFVLQNGCLVEQGVHEELLANKQKYYQLIKLS